MARRLVPLAVASALAAALVTPAALLAADTPPAPPVQPPASAPPAAPVEPDPSQPQPQPQPSPPAPEAAPAEEPAPQQAEQAADDKPLAFAATPGSVTIKDFSFGPASITVGVGETVTWRNAGPSGHTATASNGSFDTGLLSKGKSASHRFTEAGSFSYFCKPHPFMKGTVRVVASSSGSQGGTAGESGSGESSGSGSSSGSSSGSGLAATGEDAGALLALGLSFLAVGLAIRRRQQRSA
jgi:plastocyanin